MEGLVVFLNRGLIGFWFLRVGESISVKQYKSLLSKPISHHFLAMLDGVGIRKWPSPFRFQLMWLKTKGFKETLRS